MPKSFTIDPAISEPLLIPNQSLALKQYVSLLIRLHAAMREGDEETADELRDQMDAPGLLLDEDEIRLVKGVSADLYMLADAEILKPSGYSRQELRRRLDAALMPFEIHTTLALLRKAERPSLRANIAYSRYLAYQRLGLDEVARAFLLYAAELNPLHTGYKTNILIFFGDMSQATLIREIITPILSNPGADPALVVHAASELVFLLRYAHADVSRTELGQARRRVQQILNSIASRSLSSNDIILGWLTIGMIYEELGRTARAREAYQEAASVDKNYALPWQILGNSWFKEASAKALPFFQRAVELDTTDPFPYLVVANDALERDDYLKARELGDKLLEMIVSRGGATASPHLSAQVYEFLGLMEAQQNGPSQAAVEYFEEAVKIEPDNKRLTANYAELLEEAKKARLKENLLLSSTAWHDKLLELSRNFQLDTAVPTSRLFLAPNAPFDDTGYSHLLAA